MIFYDRFTRYQLFLPSNRPRFNNCARSHAFECGASNTTGKVVSYHILMCFFFVVIYYVYIMAERHAYVIYPFAIITDKWYSSVQYARRANCSSTEIGRLFGKISRTKYLLIPSKMAG